MTTLFEVRKLLFALPLLTVAAAWALPSTRDDATVAAANVSPALLAPSVDETVAPTDATDEVTTEQVEVTTEETEEIGVIDDAVDFFVISNCTYYNNANHTQVVGQFGFDCCNNAVNWGKKTAFKECGGCFPCIPPPR